MTKGQQQITTLDDEPQSEAPPARPTKAAVQSFQLDGASGKRVKITIHHGEGKAGASAAFVGVNGVGFQIPRGVKVDVPLELLGALDDAMQLVYEDVDGQMTPREVPRYPYTRH